MAREPVANGVTHIICSQHGELSDRGRQFGLPGDNHQLCRSQFGAIPAFLHRLDMDLARTLGGLHNQLRQSVE